MKRVDRYSHDLDELMTYYVNVANSIAGKKIVGNDGIHFAEAISKKVFSHITSSYALHQGLKIELNDGTFIQYIDNSSIAVLVRSALESYLTFHYVFKSPATDEEKDFRFYCWDLAGFLERKNFHTINSEAEELKRQEKESADKIKEILKKSKCYNELTRDEKKKAMRGEWRLCHSWNDLAVDAGFNTKFFADTYKYLCSYAHTGRLSALQINQAKTIHQQKELSEVYLAYNAMILSKFLFDYVDVIEETRPAFKANKKAYTIATYWKELAEGINLDKENI